MKPFTFLLKRRTFAALSIAVLGIAASAVAGPGHDHGHSHGDTASAPSANGPQRLPDGSVFLPKPAQRQLGIRTLVTEQAALPRSFELNGQVLMDPNAGGKVQPMNAGRIEPGPQGLPTLGQAVRKGQVLAYVTASAAPLERANQAAQLAELRAAKALADVEPRVGPHHEHVRVREVDEAQHAVHQRVANRDERIHRAHGHAVDQLLDQLRHALRLRG